MTTKLLLVSGIFLTVFNVPISEGVWIHHGQEFVEDFGSGNSDDVGGSGSGNLEGASGSGNPDSVATRQDDEFFDDYATGSGNPDDLDGTGSGNPDVPATTTAKTTKATTTKASTTGSSKRLKFPYKKSPVAGYKYTTVFGIHVFVNSTVVNDAKFQHTCSVIAAWMDNDQDGCVDIPAIVPKLTSIKASHVIKSRFTNNYRKAFEKFGYNFKASQDLIEVNPQCSGTKGTINCNDATLEEVFHVVTQGWELAYPKVFGNSPTKHSALTRLLDVARGGRFIKTPTKYPAKAFYTYTDQTCRYDCQAMEYLWFGMAGYLNMTKGQSDKKKEYRYINREAIKKGDPNMVKFLTNPKFMMPTVAPTGVYNGKTKCPNGVNIF